MYVTRVDDSDGVVRQRLTVYLEETEPLWPEVRVAFGWVHRAAHILANEAGSTAAPA